MKQLSIILFAVLCLLASTGGVFAQKGGSGTSLGKPEYLPNAIYEVKYWTNMAGRSSEVLLDTMIFFGHDRVAFQYSSPHAASYKYAKADSLVYMLAPKMGMGEKDWILGTNYVKLLNRATVPFKGFDRSIYRVYVATLDTKDSGMGEYMLVSNQFGIIYRYNNKGEVYMLNRIDVVRDGKIKDEIDLLPLQMELMKTEIFKSSETYSK